MTDKALVPVTPEDLILLAWFAAWTPEVHRADWPLRRAWPPGFREVEELFGKRPEQVALADRRMSAPPEGTKASRVRGLLAYRLVEGSSTCARLTPRGRAALKLAGRDCPDGFVSHCSEVFDHVLLIQEGDPGQGDVERWRDLLTEYDDKSYQGRYTLTGASASLTVASSGGTPLNGSIREHHRYLTLRVESGDRQPVLEMMFSFEQMAELLTSHAATPVTLGNYNGRDGMRRSEPAPPPVSARRRMLERLDATEDRTDDLLRELAAKIEAGNIPKKLQAELLKDLRIAQGNGRENRAHVVTQAVEEVSVAVESALGIAAERFELAGVAGRLPEARAVFALADLAPPPLAIGAQRFCGDLEARGYSCDKPPGHVGPRGAGEVCWFNAEAP